QVIYLTAQPSPELGYNNTWILGNLTPGTTIAVNITVFVLNLTNGTVINNTANVTYQNETGIFLSAYDTENTTVLSYPQYNLSNISITKTDNPDPVDVGTLLNYTINVTITGNGTAYNVTVNDTYPSQVWYVSSQPDPVAGTNNTWVLGNLTNGTLVQINITVNVSIDVPNATIITNLANATYQNETSALLTDFAIAQTTINNPLVLNRSNISITKSDNPDPARMDSMLNYTITVTSNGDGPAYNVTLNDTYPEQVIYQSSQPAPVAGTNYSWVLGNLSAGAIIQVNISVWIINLTNRAVINNTANATFQNSTGSWFIVGAGENTTILEPPVYNTSNLTITKTDTPDPVSASQNLTYQINVSSTGNGTAYNVTINDTYPEQVIYLTSQPSPVSGNNNTWVLGNLTPGRNISINVTVLVRNITNGTTINNTANVTFQNETGSVILFGAVAQTLVLNPPVFNISNISIAKTDSPDPVTQGGQLNYTIVITSTGNGTAYNVTVNDTYPEQVVYYSAQPAPITGTNNTFVIGNLTPGTTVRINISVLVNEDLPNDTIINNTVNVTWQNETGILLSGSAGASTNVSNITPPTPPPPSPGGGGGGGRRGVIIEPEKENVTLPCVENWACEEWSMCSDSVQSRICVDLNNCNTTKLKPATTRACNIPVMVLPAEVPKRTAPSSENITLQEKLEEQEKPVTVSELRIGNIVVDFKSVLPWVILTALLCIIILTAYYVATGRRKESVKEMPVTAEAQEEKPEELPEPKQALPPVSTQMRPPRISKSFYKGIDKKLASINRKLERLGKMSKKLGK
ncbi:MAG: DUF11 domain-containing protein, partial [Candidatus Woesearchaeota archaeon]